MQQHYCVSNLQQLISNELREDFVNIITLYGYIMWALTNGFWMCYTWIMRKSCENCGCRVYDGHCVNCHEEIFIAVQNTECDEPIVFSQEFQDKLDQQEKEAKKIRKLLLDDSARYDWFY